MSTETISADAPAAIDGLPAERRNWAAAAIFTALAMASLDTAIANVALPAIAADLHVGPADVIWVVNVYQIALVATLLPLGAHSLGLRGRNDPGTYWPLFLTTLLYVASFGLRRPRARHVRVAHVAAQPLGQVVAPMTVAERCAGFVQDGEPRRARHNEVDRLSSSDERPQDSRGVRGPGCARYADDPRSPLLVG